MLKVPISKQNKSKKKIYNLLTLKTLLKHQRGQKLSCWLCLSLCARAMAEAASLSAGLSLSSFSSRVKKTNSSSVTARRNSRQSHKRDIYSRVCIHIHIGQVFSEKVQIGRAVPGPAFTEPTVPFSGVFSLARHSTRFAFFPTPVFRQTLTCAVID